MKSGGGRIKGYAFQRKVAKILSDWWGVKNSFVSSPGSGAWSKLSKYAGKAPVADLVTPEEFPFSVECKKEEAFEFHHLLANPDKCLLQTWFNLLVQDCTKVGKKPMLVFSKNFWEIFVVIKKTDFATIFEGQSRDTPVHIIWKELVILKLLDFCKVPKEKIISLFFGKPIIKGETK